MDVGFTGVRSFVLRPDYDFARLRYVSLRRRERIPFSSAIHGQVEVRRARGSALDRIVKNLQEKRIHRAFGFPKAPAERQLRKSRLPDLSGTFEDVELMQAAWLPDGVLFGLLVVYQSRGITWPEQELDFALIDQSYAGRPALIRQVRTAILSYLFALCGVRKAYWLRRKEVRRTAPGGRSRSYYRRFGDPVVSSLERFQASLHRWSASGGDPDLPRIELDSRSEKEVEAASAVREPEHRGDL